MEEWKQYRLIDVLDTLIDYRGKTPKKTSSGVPLITAKIIKNGRIETPTEFISVDDYDSWMVRGFPKVGDVVLTTEAPLGEVAQLDDANIALAQRVVTLRGKSDVLDNTYLKYFFLSNVGQQRLKARETGTTVTGIKQSELREVIVDVPPYGIQVGIAKVLKSLDDKIEVNRRINDNLEQQAQALFKSWFVDFEPFKNGEFVESELGMIPKGWRVGKLGELCQFKRGKGLLSKNAIPGDVPVVAGGLEPACYHNTSNTKAPVITVSGSGANAGFMRMYHQEVWASDCSFIDITCENWLFVYCFLAINSHLLKHAQTGAVQPHVKPADIHDFDLAIPPKEYIQRFQDKISSFITKKGLIEQESRRLAELRDTLLPRLMSGDLRVTDMDLVNKLMENNIF
jgi:type I restriction enzyme S subunit